MGVFYRLVSVLLIMALAGVVSVSPRTANEVSANSQQAPASANFITTDATTPIVSTRGHFDLNTGLLLPPEGATTYDMTPNIPRLGSGHCTGEVVVFVHGFQNDQTTAINNFNLVKRSFQFNNYGSPVIGFSWDSNPSAQTTTSIWFVAKNIAESNGPKLARFLSDFKQACPGATVRLVGHSLGARVILTALQALENDSTWKSKGFQIATVHILGGAVDNEEVSTNPSYGFGSFIEKQACEFHNKYNPADDILDTVFLVAEADFALGATGAEKGVPLPANYHEENVQNQIIPTDTNGDGIPDTGFGDNHSGYIGLIENGVYLDDGAIDRVVDDWDRQLQSVACLKNLSDNDGSSGFQDMAALDNNVYVVWEDKTSGNFDVFFRRSDDFGATFKDTVNLSLNSSDSRFPEIAVDGSDVYVVWDDSTPGNPEIFLTISSDGGATFGPIINASANPMATRNAQVAASGGQAFVTWSTTNFLVSGASSLYGEVYLQSFDNQGIPAGIPLNISETPTGFSDMPRVASSGGAAYVVWQEGGLFGVAGDNGDIWVRALSVGGVIGPQLNLSQGVSPQPSNSVYPHIAAWMDQVYVAWNDDAPGNFDTFLAISTDQGVSFGAPQNLSQTGGQSYDLEVAADGGNACVAWSDGGLSLDILFRSVINGGSSFGPTQNLSQNAADSILNGLDASGPNVFAAWSDADNGAFDTFFRASVNQGVTFGPQMPAPPVNLSQNDGDTWVTTVVAEGDSFYIAWTDFTPGKADVFFSAGTIQQFTPLTGTITLKTPDRGVLPLKQVQVQLVYPGGIESTFTNNQGAYRIVLPPGVTSGSLRLFLGDSRNILEVQHKNRGVVPAFIETPSINLTTVHSASIQLSGSAPNFKLNGTAFVPANTNVNPVADFPHLAGIYYYSLVALNFTEQNLPGLALDDHMPLEVVGFSINADPPTRTTPTSFFTSAPEPTLNIKTRGPLPAKGSAGDPGGSRMADALSTEYEIDTLFHEIGHYLIYESAIGGENNSINTDRNLHPNLVGTLNCHKGYAQLNSSCAWSEGVATFLSAVTTDTMLTDPGHVVFHANAGQHTMQGGATIALETSFRVAGPRLSGPPAQFVLNTGNEEYVVTQLLWDLYDNTPAEDPVAVPIKTLWQSLTNPANNPGNPAIITTLADIYTAMVNSGLVTPANMTQLYFRSDICVDANGNLACDTGEAAGTSAWPVTVSPTLSFAYPYAATISHPAYPYGASRPEIDFDPVWALSVDLRDDQGDPLQDVKLSVNLVHADGMVLDYDYLMEGPEQLVGFMMQDGSQADLAFSKDGFLPEHFAFTSDQYLLSVLDDTPYALSFNVSLQRLNQPPVAHNLSGMVDEDTLVTVVLTGGDPEGDPLSFVIVGSPSHGQLGPVTPINATSASVQYTPDPNFNGGDTFTFKTNDGRDDSLPATAQLNLRPINDRPVSDAGPDQTVDGGVQVILNGAASSDVDGDPLTFSWQQVAGPTVVPSDPALANPGFTAPLVDTDTILSFSLTVNDGHASSLPDGVNILVKAPFGTIQAPVANAGPDQQVFSSTTVVLDGSASYDPDGSALTYSWQQLSGPTVLLSDIHAVAPSFTAPGGYEMLSFQLTVNNGVTNSSPAGIVVSKFFIFIPPPNLGPVADAGLDQYVNEGDPVNLDATGSTGSVSYFWLGQANLSDYQSPTPSFVAPMVTQDTVYTMTLITTSTGVNTQSCLPLIIPGLIAPRIDCDTDAVNIFVKDINDPPVAVTGPDQVVAPGGTVILDGTGSSDPDGDPLIYNWQQIAGPVVTFTGLGTATPSFDVPVVSTDTVLSFLLQVNDGTVSSDLSAVNVVIAAGALPPSTTPFGDIIPLGQGRSHYLGVSGNYASVVFSGFGSLPRDIFLLRSADKGATFEAPVNLSNTGSPSYNSQVTTLGSNVYVSWIDSTVGPMIRVSHDNGQTFGSIVYLSATAVDAFAQQLVVEGNGVYAVWQSGTQIHFRRSVDQGNSFLGVPLDLTASFTGPFYAGNPSIKVSGNNVYVAWRHSPAHFDVNGFIVYDSGQIYVTVSNDGGASFSAPTQISDSLGSAISFPSDGIEVSGSNVFVLWEDDSSGSSEVLLSRSADGGSTFGSPVNLSNSLSSSTRSAMSAAGTDLYVAWSEGPWPDQLFLKRSTDGGASFFPTANLSNVDGYATETDLVAVGNKAYVVWFQSLFTPCCDYQLIFRESDDLGATFSAPRDLDDVGGSQVGPNDPQVIVSNGEVFVLWRDAELEDMFFRGPPVSNSNPPMADTGPDQNVLEGSPVTLDGSNSSDPDGDPLSFLWTQVAGSPVTLSDMTSPVPTFNAPLVNADAALVFSLVVNDGAADSLPSAVTVVVHDVPPPSNNSAPVADAGPDQEVAQGATVILDGTDSMDPDGDPITFQWTQVNGPAVVLSDPSSPTPQFQVATIDADTVYTFMLVVNDGTVDSNADAVDLYMAPPAAVPQNNQPVADAGTDVQVVPGQAVSLDGSASYDPDGDPITFTWVQVSGPNTLLTGDDTVSPSITAPLVAVDTLLVYQLTVSDSQLDSTPDGVIITVRKTPGIISGDAPVADAGPDQMVGEGTPVSLDGSASQDPNGDAITFWWTQIGGPTGTLSDNTAEKPTFTAPQVNADTLLVFQLVVNDGTQDSVPDAVMMLVENAVANAQPVANAGPDQIVSGGDMVMLDGSGSYDSDVDPLTFFWAQTAGPTAQILAPGFVAPGFLAPQLNSDTQFQFQLIVNDGFQDSLADYVDVTVLGIPLPPVNHSPQADAGPDISVLEGAQVTLDGSGSHDPDGDILTFAWSQSGGPAVTLSNPAAATPTFTAPSLNDDAVITFQLIVNDGQVDSDPDSVAVHVSQSAMPPVRDTQQGAAPSQVKMFFGVEPYLVGYVEDQRPVFDVPPSPTEGEVYEVNAGDVLSLKVQCSDPDVQDFLTLTASQIPPGASFWLGALPQVEESASRPSDSDSKGVDEEKVFENRQQKSRSLESGSHSSEGKIGLDEEERKGQPEKASNKNRGYDTHNGENEIDELDTPDSLSSETINPISGTLMWEPETAQVVNVFFICADNYGLSTTHGFSIEVLSPEASLGKITAGGAQLSKDINFGFVVQSSDGINIKGELQYQDKKAKVNLHSVEMTSLTISPDLTSGRFSGTAKVNGAPSFTFVIDVQDNGEPGRTDTFKIVIPELNYTSSGALAKGNIQIH